MPELPEVQTIADDLRKRVLGRRIMETWVGWPKLIKTSNAKEFIKGLRGAKVVGVSRRGKNILIRLDKDRLLAVHPKMTGHFLVGRWRLTRGRWLAAERGVPEDRKYKHIRLLFTLDDGEMLALSDVRKFAKVLFGRQKQILNLPDLKKLGPEPIHSNLTEKKFAEILRNRKGKIKQVLLDQEVVAGIGNIYADEILWRARIHPLRVAGSLSSKELHSIYTAMQSILRKAVRLRGTSIRDFRDSKGREGGYARALSVYGRGGEACLRCRRKILRIKIGSRSSHFCPDCQRPKPQALMGRS